MVEERASGFFLLHERLHPAHTGRRGRAWRLHVRPCFSSETGRDVARPPAIPGRFVEGWMREACRRAASEPAQIGAWSLRSSMPPRQKVRAFRKAIDTARGGDGPVPPASGLMIYVNETEAGEAGLHGDPAGVLFPAGEAHCNVDFRAGGFGPNSGLYVGDERPAHAPDAKLLCRRSTARKRKNVRSRWVGDDSARSRPRHGKHDGGAPFFFFGRQHPADYG